MLLNRAQFPFKTCFQFPFDLFRKLKIVIRTILCHFTLMHDHFCLLHKQQLSFYHSGPSSTPFCHLKLSHCIKKDNVIQTKKKCILVLGVSRATEKQILVETKCIWLTCKIGRNRCVHWVERSELSFRITFCRLVIAFCKRDGEFASLLFSAKWEKTFSSVTPKRNLSSTFL